MGKRTRPVNGSPDMKRASSDPGGRMATLSYTLHVGTGLKHMKNKISDIL